MKFLALVSCLLLSLAVSAQEIYQDVESVPALRTQSYPAKDYKHIIIFSAQRTGSSLVYNVFRFLFEDSDKLFARHNNFTSDRVVLKAHTSKKFLSVDPARTLCIFTFRNPWDASISNYRICTRKTIENKAFAQKLINRHASYLLFSEQLQQKGQSLIRLKYEDFVDDLDSLFRCIEEHFNITIDLRDKELMRKSYSKENIKACTKGLKNFSEFLPISGFHGQHVNAERYIPPADFLYWLKVYMKEVSPLFQAYGYPPVECD